MKLLFTLGMAAGLLTVGGCAKSGPEAGPRHEVKIQVELKIPSSTDYNWSFQAFDEYKGNRQQLASNGGRGGYHYERFEHNKDNMAPGHVFTTMTALSPSGTRPAILPTTVYITMKITVDGTVKADTTINYLMPANSRGGREAMLRVAL